MPRAGSYLEIVELFRRKPKPETTGHSGDDERLGQLAQQGALDKPHNWIHHFVAATEDSALQAATVIKRSNWDITDVLPTDDGSGWLVVIRRKDVVLTYDLVRETRSYFTSLEGAAAGGSYLGWGLESEHIHS